MTGLSKKDIYGKAQIFLGLLVFGVMLASPVMADDRDDRLRNLEREVETLGRAVYSGEARPGGQGGSRASADTEVRIQGLENEIRNLTGKIEEKDYEIRQLREQLEKLSVDIDTRFGEMQGGGGGGQMNGGFTNNPIRNGSMNNDGGMQYRDHSMDQQPQDIPQPEAPANTGGYQWKSGAAAGSGAKAGQLGTMTQSGADSSQVAAGDTAATLYENAFSLLKGAQYDEAEKEFKSFLRQYPGHALTANAKYWLGETYYVRGQFEKGAQTFAEGYQAAPKGSKAADNLLKMGMSLSGMGKKPEACVALGQIGKEFASAGPVLRRAQQEMTRLGC